MPRFNALLPHLLAALLLMQWAAGLLPHLRAMGGAAETVVICTPEGLHTVRLDQEGRPAKPEPPQAACCLLCQAPPASAGLVPPAPLPARSQVAAPAPALAAAVRELGFRPPPRILHSRAPPAPQA